MRAASTTGIILVLVVVYSGTLLPRTVSAQILQDPVAIELKKRGDEAIELGRYDVALDAYSRALSIEPSAALHYNRGRALQALARHAEALEAFEDFVATATPELKAAVPQLTQLIELTRSRVAYVTVTNPVVGATVTLGTRVWSLPLSAPLRFDPGDLTFEVQAPGFLPEKTSITLRSGMTQELNGMLTPVDLTANLRVNSAVAGAMVDVDGKALGTVPTEVNLAPGAHQLRVSHPNYHEAVSRVVLKARERRELSIVLEPKPQFYERWWFWVAVGAVAAGGVVLGVALTTERSASSGDIPPGQITAPLTRF